LWLGLTLANQPTSVTRLPCSQNIYPTPIPTPTSTIPPPPPFPAMASVPARALSTSCPVNMPGTYLIRQELLALPLFILMGNGVSTNAMSRSLFQGLDALGRVDGRGLDVERDPAHDLRGEYRLVRPRRSQLVIGPHVLAELLRRGLSQVSRSVRLPADRARLAFSSRVEHLIISWVARRRLYPETVPPRACCRA